MNASASETVYDFAAKDIDGRERSLREFAGKALLIVNVASKCGFTPQYQGLEALWRKHRDEGFAVLGFPCDQFGHQEPGDEAEIKQFCSLTYDVTFPLFAKIDVNGARTHPLYLWLKGEKAGVFGTEAIKWNFTKFLVDRSGKVVKRFAPSDTPEKIDKQLADVLGEPERS
jgi:glutathione peroxidase